MMIEQQAHIGIALDGDGDRVVLVDEQANIITADRLLSLFSQMCLENHPGHAVVFDVKCSSMVRNTVRNLGGHPHMIRTGSSFLRKYLSQSGGYAVLVESTLATMYLMMVVVLAMMMVYMQRYVSLNIWDISQIKVIRAVGGLS